MALIPPSPVGSPFGSFTWADWYEKVRRAINASSTLAWSQITDFTGSNLTSILTRLHKDLQGLQGGTTNEYYHLTNAEYTLVHAGVSTLTDAATIAVDASLANNFRVVLGGNRTLGAPSNPTSGQVINIRIVQDGTGSRTLAYNSVYKFPGGSAPVLTTTAGAKDFMSCQYDATDATWFCVLNKAFA